MNKFEAYQSIQNDLIFMMGYHPGLRIGQILSNFQARAEALGKDIYYMSDYELAKAFTEYKNYLCK